MVLHNSRMQHYLIHYIYYINLNTCVFHKNHKALLIHNKINYNNGRCKYNGCLHINEPHCKIKELVANNEILKSRYENYLQFIEEVKNKRKW